MARIVRPAAPDARLQALKDARLACWRAWCSHASRCGKCAPNPWLYATGCAKGRQLVDLLAAAIEAVGEYGKLPDVGSGQDALW